MSTKKPIVIDCATEKMTESVLPLPPILSSVMAGWDNLFLEYHRQPSGEHPEVCASGHTIAIFTEVEKENLAERTVGKRLYRHSVQAGDILIIPAYTSSKNCWQCEDLIRLQKSLIRNLNY
jgi:hypothetical protein